MKLSLKLLTLLLFFSCPVFAGTGAAEDGQFIMFVLAGLLAVIWGVPYLVRYSKKTWQYIKLKIQKYFSTAETEKTKRMLFSHF